MKLNLSQNWVFLPDGILIEILELETRSRQWISMAQNFWRDGITRETKVIRFCLDFMAFIKIEMFTVECDIDKITPIVLRIRNDFIYAFDCRAHRLCSKINSLGMAWQVGKFNEQYLCSLYADVRHWKAGAMHSTIR